MSVVNVKKESYFDDCLFKRVEKGSEHEIERVIPRKIVMTEIRPAEDVLMK